MRIRAGSAFFAAVVMLYCAYFVFKLTPGEGLFATGDAVFHYTLRGGGVLLLLVAVLGWIEAAWSLPFSGAVWLLVGIGLTGSAALMMSGGAMGLQQLVYVFLGISSLRRGYQDVIDWGYLRRLIEHQPAQEGAVDEAPSRPLVLSERSPARPPVAVPPKSDSAATSTPLPPAEGGYLASFASKPAEDPPAERGT